VSTAAGGKNCHMPTPGYPMKGTNLLPTTCPGAGNAGRKLGCELKASIFFSRLSFSAFSRCFSSRSSFFSAYTQTQKKYIVIGKVNHHVIQQ